MHGTGGAPPTVLLALITLTVTFTPAAAAPAPADPPIAPDEDPPAEDVLDAYIWSTVHDDTLLSPLVTATAPHGWTDELLTAWKDGQTWADATLDTADRATLASALVTLAAATNPDQPLDAHQLATDEVPDAILAPLATLVQLQTRSSTPSTPLAPVPTLDASASPWQTARADAIDAAFTLGALETLRDTLHEAKHAVHLDEPLPLDPLGLVILGSSNDDTYTPNTVGPLTLQGPLLLVEPGGDDTYHVPVAARTLFQTPPTPVFGWENWFADLSAIAIEMEGNDRYFRDTATAQNFAGTHHLLLDEAGHDTYGTLDNDRNLAHAEPGFAYLHDKAGDDVYRAHERSLGYAKMLNRVAQPSAIAVLADKEGDDSYHGEFRSLGHADNAGAIAFIRDYQGEDTYIAESIAYGSADDDGTAQLWDDNGDDDYHIAVHGPLDYGYKAITEGGLVFAPTERSSAYFLDGNGTDSYTRDGICCPDLGFYPLPVENDLTRVNTTDEHRWGIFVDCKTPPDAPVPCPEEQATVLETIALGET